MSAIEPTITFPGLICTRPPTLQKLGPGLVPFSTDSALSTRAGILHQAPTKYHVDSSFKRYIPAQNDYIIGQIVLRHAEGYRVDIASSLPASLDALAFFNVNRKNKPNLQVGDIVYARISSHLNGMEPELVCTTADNKAGGLGQLSVADGQGYGFLFKNLSLGLCRRLLDPHDTTLVRLGKVLEYEIVVGLNGRIWVQSEAIETVVIVGEIIKESEFLKEDEIRELVGRKFKVMR